MNIETMPNFAKVDSATNRIRILQLGSPTGLYGAERWILALVKHLDKSKFDIQVAAFRDDPSLDVPLCTEAAKLGFKTHILEVSGRIHPSFLTKLRKLIKSEGINILHTHAYKQDLIGLLAVQGTGCKVISTPHGWSKEPDFKLWCYEMLNRAAFPFFDAVVPLSDDLHKPLKRFPLLSKKLYLIKNGVDITEIESVNEIAPEIIDLKKKGKFVIGYIGQLIHRKGLDVLLEAVSKLTSDLNWHLIIVGEGSLKDTLQKKSDRLKISNRSSFLGFRKDRLSILKGLDVFILPSRLEGIPRCLMESMAAGVPNIASDISGCRDLLQGIKNGFLFEPENSHDLKETIECVAAKKKEDNLQAIKNNASKYVKANFSANRMAKEYSEIYKCLVKKIKIPIR